MIHGHFVVLASLLVPIPVLETRDPILEKALEHLHGRM